MYHECGGKLGLRRIEDSREGKEAFDMLILVCCGQDFTIVSLTKNNERLYAYVACCSSRLWLPAPSQPPGFALGLQSVMILKSVSQPYQALSMPSGMPLQTAESHLTLRDSRHATPPDSTFRTSTLG